MILIIDNFDSFTYNVSQVMATLTDEPVRVVRNDELSLKEIERLAPNFLVISPGPGRPAEAGISIEAIKHFAGKIPILGVCLGHQAIGEAFGGKIIQAKRIVHGKVEDMLHDGKGLFRGIPSPASFVRYHSLAIEEASLPADLEITARSRDDEIMGVRHRKFLIEGVQFHPESIASDAGKQLLKNFLNYRREAFPFKQSLSAVVAGKNLSQDEAAAFMDELTDGNLSDIQIAGYLMALESKGVTAEEIAGCARTLLKKRVKVAHATPVLDTCGTGGDGLGTFNISSLAAIAAAACGAPVAKHGNRAVSSLSGSADFYGELGININLSPEKSAELIRKTGFAFLFAPIYHGAMRYAGPARKALGVKTIMNLLGPLANPAGAEYQIIGVYSKELCLPVAQAARLLGVKRVLTLHSADGMDEISPAAATDVVEIGEDGEIKQYQISPEDFGISGFTIAELEGGSAKENAERATALLSGAENESALFHAVALNAGAGLYISKKTESLKAGYESAKTALRAGAVKEKLQSVQKLSQEMA
jgi:anthranilate synthase/phosphoribosyltransferase